MPIYTCYLSIGHDTHTHTMEEVRHAVVPRLAAALRAFTVHVARRCGLLGGRDHEPNISQGLHRGTVTPAPVTLPLTATLCRRLFSVQTSARGPSRLLWMIWAAHFRWNSTVVTAKQHRRHIAHVCSALLRS